MCDRRNENLEMDHGRKNVSLSLTTYAVSPLLSNWRGLKNIEKLTEEILITSSAHSGT